MIFEEPDERLKPGNQIPSFWDKLGIVWKLFYSLYKFLIIGLGTLIIFFLFLKPEPTKSFLTHFLNGGYFQVGDLPETDNENSSDSLGGGQNQDIDDLPSDDQPEDIESEPISIRRKRGIFLVDDVYMCDSFRRESIVIYPSSSTKLNSDVEDLLLSKAVFTRNIERNKRLNVESDLGGCPNNN